MGGEQNQVSKARRHVAAAGRQLEAETLWVKGLRGCAWWGTARCVPMFLFITMRPAALLP